MSVRPTVLRPLCASCACFRPVFPLNFRPMTTSTKPPASVIRCLDFLDVESATNDTASVSFASLGVSGDIHGRLPKNGLLKPTAAQVAAIPAILRNASKDVTVFAETGSGKTLAYLLPLMTKLYENRRAADESTRLSAVVVVPTRELAHQVSEVLKLLQPTDNSKPSSSSRKLSIRKLVGAVTPRMLNSLQLDPPHVVVGLPHTLSELVPKSLRPGSLLMVVVDEIDHVASPWSRSAAEAVLTAFTDVANRPQIVFVGATSSGGSYELVQKYLGNGHTVVDLTNNGSTPLPTQLKHVQVSCVNDKQLLPNITRVLAALKPRRVLAFCNSLTELEATLTFLRAKKVKVDSLVSTKPNAERRTVLQQFHDGKLHALLSLEGGSRGLDYKNVDLVINVGPPPNVREYVHRAGRTARNGKPGTVVTLTVGDEQASTFMKYAGRLGFHDKMESFTAEDLGKMSVVPPKADGTAAPSGTK